MEIGKAFGCKELIATGSRAIGSHVEADDLNTLGEPFGEASDYDFIIVDDVSKNTHYRSLAPQIEQDLNVKLDFLVNNKPPLRNGWVYLTIEY